MSRVSLSVHSARPVLHGLYAVTDAQLIPADQLLACVEQALKGGAALVQYRDKGTDAARREAEARALLTLCRAYNVPLIINDDVELACRVAAHGVHLGRDDGAVSAARRQMGVHALIGVSCYNSLERAVEAQAQGADYAAFGAFFPSVTKPTTIRAHSDVLRQARACLSIPIVAIGGITPDNGGALIAAGADLLAVVHGVFGQADKRAAAHAYAQLFKP